MRVAFGVRMKRRGMYAVLAGVSSLALLAPRARMQSAPQAQQKVDTRMATDERLHAAALLWLSHYGFGV